MCGEVVYGVYTEGTDLEYIIRRREQEQGTADAVRADNLPLQVLNLFAGYSQRFPVLYLETGKIRVKGTQHCTSLSAVFSLIT